MSFGDNPFLALLCNQLCQVTALCLLVGATVRAFCRRRPHLAYLLWLLVVLKCLTPPLWSSPTGVFSWLTRLAEEPKQIADRAALDGEPSGPFSLGALGGIVTAGRAAADGAGAHRYESHAGVEKAIGRISGTFSADRVLLGLWATGAGLLGAFAIFQVLCCSWVLRRHTVPGDEALSSLADGLSKTLGLRRPAKLFVTSKPIGPLVFGFLRPKLVLPRALVDGANNAEIEPVLAHELVHVRRCDTLVGAVQFLAQLLWWFHPLVWWANREASRERERCCDQEVVAGLAFDPAAYARSLLAVLDLKRTLRLSLLLPSLSPFEVTSRRLGDIADRGKKFHPRTPRHYWLVLAAACVVALPGAGWTLTSSQRAPEESKSGDKPSESAKESAPLTPECAAILQQIEELEKGIPARFVGLKRPAEEIYKDMMACMELCRRFLAQCPNAARAGQAKATLARLQLASLSRYEDELRRDTKLTDAERAKKQRDRIEEALKLAEETAAESPAGSRPRMVALQTCVGLYEKLEHYEKLRATAELILEEYPKYEGRPSLHLSVAQSFLNERRYVDTVKYLRIVIQQHPDDLEYVVYIEKLFDALTGAGDLGGMEELLHFVLVECPERLKAMPPDHYLRPQYEQWICVAPFWLGFVCMALGENAGAHEELEKQIANASVRVNQLTAGGKGSQNDVCNIFSEFRSKDLLDWLDNFRGKVPKTDFDLGELWATEKKATLRESRGKVFVALFRMPGNKRAASFLKEIDELLQGPEKDRLAGVTVGYLSGQPDPTADESALKAMREDLEALGVSLPAGYDPDRKHSLFTLVHATVGTSSLVVFNKKGEMAWYLADPRDMDRMLLRTVIERLLKE